VALKARGTSLLELLIVMSIWSMLLIVIIGFHAQSNILTRRHDALSGEYRILREFFDTVDSLVTHSKLVAVHNFRAEGVTPSILLHRPDLSKPVLEGGLVNWVESEELLTVDARNNSIWVNSIPLEANIVIRRWDTREGRTVQQTLVQLPLAWRYDFYDHVLLSDDERLKGAKGHGISTELTRPERNNKVQLTDSSQAVPGEIVMMHFTLLENNPKD